MAISQQDFDEAIENGRVNLAVERTKVLARALHCYPAVLVFPVVMTR